MQTKQTLKNKAINWLAENQPDLEQMHHTEILNRMVDSLFTEFMEIWIQGVGTGAEMNAQAEREMAV